MHDKTAPRTRDDLSVKCVELESPEQETAAALRERTRGEETDLCAGCLAVAARLFFVGERT